MTQEKKGGKVESVKEPEGATPPSVEPVEEPGDGGGEVGEIEPVEAVQGVVNEVKPPAQEKGAEKAQEKPKAKKQGKKGEGDEPKLAMDVNGPPRSALAAAEKARVASGENSEGGGDGEDLTSLVREVVRILKDLREDLRQQTGGPFLG